jgi:molybdopterin converting factor small subunit
MKNLLTTSAIALLSTAIIPSANAVNLNFAEPQTILKNGDEVALIPPVSGG